MSDINNLNLSQLYDRAFKVLPHLYRYDQNRQVEGVVLWDEAPEFTYEKFSEVLDFYLGEQDEKGILSLERLITKTERQLERYRQGKNYVAEVGQFPEPDWIVEGQVVRNGLTLLLGKSGSGKTTYGFYLADAVQQGHPLFGLVCKKGEVIFVENDEAADLLRSHRDKVGLPYPLNVANINVNWDATNKKFNPEFDEMLYLHSPDMVIIDAYTSLGIPDITRPDSALVLDELRRLAVARKCAFLIIHHLNESGEQMGSNLHIAKMDSIILLENDDNVVTLTQQKIRGTKFQPKALDFDPVTLKMTLAKVNYKDLVRQYKAQGFTLAQVQVMIPQAKKDTIRKYYRS